MNCLRTFEPPNATDLCVSGGSHGEAAGLVGGLLRDSVALFRGGPGLLCSFPLPERAALTERGWLEEDSLLQLHFDPLAETE
jgi:hypothetical protein